jgi:hypothetical protein
MKTFKDTLAAGEIITESGRVFRPVHKEFLDKLPPELVKEMAKRRLEEIKASEKGMSEPGKGKL